MLLNETMTKYYRVFDHSNVINKLLANLTYETNAFVTELIVIIIAGQFRHYCSKIYSKIAIILNPQRCSKSFNRLLTDRAYLDSVYLV